MCTPWKNGIYVSDKARHMLQKVDGQHVDMYSIAYLDFPDMKAIADDGIWTFGDFGPAHEEVQNASGGIKNLNLEMKLFEGMFHMHGVLSEDGKKIYTIGIVSKL